MKSESRKKVLAALLVFVLVFCLTGCGSRASKDEPEQKSSASGERVCYLTVQEYCENREFDYEKGDTAYDLLKKSGIEFEKEDGTGGVFITKIGELEGDDSRAWVFTINDEEIMESADNAKLEPGDSVEYSYIEF